MASSEPTAPPTVEVAQISLRRALLGMRVENGEIILSPKVFAAILAACADLATAVERED